MYTHLFKPRILVNDHMQVMCMCILFYALCIQLHEQRLNCMGIESHIYTLTTFSICVNIIVMAFCKMFVFAIWFHFAVVEHTQYCIYLPCFFTTKS